MTQERPIWPYVVASLAVIAILALAFKPAPLEHSPPVKPVGILTINISAPHASSPAPATTQMIGAHLNDRQ